MNPVETFFRLLFGPHVTGVVCIATLTPSKDFQEFYYEWPLHLNLMLEKVQEHAETRNVYVCPQLLVGRKRSRVGVKVCTNVWIDLEECSPDNLLVKPSISIESSPGRYQAYWLLEEPVQPDVAELISKRIAYHHAGQGADRGGWDLSQLLRVPLTYNLKYDKPEPVKLLDITKTLYRPGDFDKYPTIDKLDVVHESIPVIPDLGGQDILSKYGESVPPQLEFLFRDVPKEGTWSEKLWELTLSAFESGLTAPEVFVLARDAGCNKFRRDTHSSGQADDLLWRDVCRAQAHVKQQRAELREPEPIVVPKDIKLLSDAEWALVKDHRTFIQEYIEWAKKLGDAAEQYHQAGALVCLSALISGSVRLPTSFGTIKPNLWFMILADTTLTRKTTAMDIAMELLEDIDSSVILATDGSIEGLMGSLSTRPGKPSIFLRDEFSGLLESMTKKDYYAGMAETLTKLYDGKLQKRVLKKEVIEVKDPVLIMFAGGIKDKVCSLLNYEYISSGFLPRFVFITAESDVAKVRPLGPPTNRDTTGRQRILDVLQKLHRHYHTESVLHPDPVTGKLIMSAPSKWDAELTNEAWLRYNQLESDMMNAAMATEVPDILMPVYDRLAKSALKTAILLAAADQLVRPSQAITVDLKTLLVAISYMKEWQEYGATIIQDIGVSRDERLFRSVIRHIELNPGKTRSILMQRLHLNARQTDQILTTLEQRQQVRRDKKAGGERLFPILNQPQEAKA